MATHSQLPSSMVYNLLAGMGKEYYVCICMYVYIYIYVIIFIHTHIHTYIYIYIYTYTMFINVQSPDGRHGYRQYGCRFTSLSYHCGVNRHLSVTTPCFFQGQATLWRRMARRQCEGGRVMSLGRVGLPEWISRIRILNGFVMYDLL